MSGLGNNASMHLFLQPVSPFLQSGIHRKRQRVFCTKSPQQRRQDVLFFLQLNSTCTHVQALRYLPQFAKHRLHRPGDWLPRLTEFTLWIFSRSWANTLANMWFINMPCATPNSVRQRADKLFKHGATIPGISAPQLRQSAGRGSKKISCAANHILTLLSFSSWVNDYHLSLVPGPDCF